MNLSTKINHRTRLMSIVQDAYHYCRISGWTHEKLLDYLKEHVYSDSVWKKVPGWVRQSATDLTDYLSNELYKPNLHAKELERLLDKTRKGLPTEPVAYLRWASRVDGVEITTDEICKRREAGDENIWNRVEGTHIWNHKPGNPFSPWKNTAGL